MTTSPRTPEPTLVFPAAIMSRAAGLKAAIFDVDGVLTDGTLYISEAGETLKAFHALDGHGLKLLATVGITPIVITGRDSPSVRRRLKDLGVTEAVFGAHDKLAVAEPVLARLGVAWHEVAVMGDDWPDLPLLVRAGLAVAPANGHAEVRALAHHVCAARGGQGAARECCDLILLATGHYRRLLQGHAQTLDTTAEGPRT
jgi:3-deoxy-D-manno-octulosonate 8-phosphate phosphatase (KDO 8-P phosphatase)